MPPKVVDDWAAAGNDGWSYREVLPYFKKSENNEKFGETPFHGKGGPLNVKDVDEYSPLVEIMSLAAESLQMRRTEDFNGREQEGFGTRQLTHLKGRRVSSATAFLDPARGRKNLTVVDHGLVDRVVLENRRAVGVEVIVRGARRRIMARREIILSGGVIASPMILMRSGIGPGAELSRHGIAVVHDLPGVGQNLQEHAAVAVQHESPTTIPYGISWRTAPRLAWSLVEYALFRTGLLANNMFHAGGFVRTDPQLDRPDIQFILMPLLRRRNGRSAWGHGYGFLTVLLRPKSRGEIKLTAAAPAAAPHIDFRFLAEPADLDLILRGVKLSRRLLAAPAFDRVRGPEYSPGEQVEDDDALRDYIRRNVATVFHAVGTCRMGQGADAVVDEQLRVRGVAGLRVVDASIMPTIIGGNTNAPVIMIAEKAADMIRGKAPLPAAQF